MPPDRAKALAVVPDWRPTTRGDCDQVERPCPFVSCKHHLYLDVSQGTGSVKLNFPDLEPDELAESCCLDVADEGGATLEHVGQALNVTRERVRQVEVKAFGRLQELEKEVEGEERTPTRVFHRQEPR